MVGGTFPEDRFDVHPPHPATLLPHGLAEAGFSALAALPGWAGRVGYRKLKRRIAIRARAEFDRLAASLAPGDIAIDLGANVGDFTRRLAATGAEVHAFEPDPETFAVLSDRMSHLPNVRLHNKAAGAAAGSVPIFRPLSWYQGQERSASKAVSVVASDRTAGFVQAGEAEMIDFAAFLRALPRPAALVKVDIEGAEWDLIRAVMDRASDRFAAMFVETHERFDPARVAEVKALQARFRRDPVPYVNLYWM